MGFLALLLYTALMFLRPGELYPALAPLRLAALGSVIAVGATLWEVLRGKGPSYRAPQIYLVLLFSGWAALSVVLAQRWFGGATQALATLSPGLLLFFLVVLNVDSLSRLRLYAGWLVLMGTVISVQGILAIHTGYHEDALIFRYGVAEDGTTVQPDEDAEAETSEAEPVAEDANVDVPRVRHLGLLNDPNDLAQALVAMLPLLLVARPRRASVGVHLLLLSMAAAMLYTVYLTHSRGGVVALAAVIFVAVSERLGRVLALVLTALGTGGLLLGGFAAGRSVAGDSSTMGRIEAWTEGFQMLKESPVWGIGFGSFGDLNGLVAHNSYVHCLAELGLVGYFLWLSVIVFTIVELTTLVRARTRAADPDAATAAGPSEEGSGETTSAARADTRAEYASVASSLRTALIGFLAAAYFLSRAYTFLLFLLVALPVVLVDVSRRETGEPPLRLLQNLVLGAVATVLSVVVLNISVKIGIRLLMR